MQGRAAMAGVIESALGEDWDRLAPLVRRHFGIDEGTGETELVLKGTMEVIHGGPGRLVFPLLGAFGVLVPHQGREVPCTVRHRMQRGALLWEREFQFPGKAAHRFSSSMTAEGYGCCVERVAFGFAIVMKVACEEEALVFEDVEYAWQIGRCRLPLRLRWLLGALRVEERQEGNDLVMSLTLRHGWCGRLFLYRGRFAITDVDAPSEHPEQRPRKQRH